MNLIQYTLLFSRSRSRHRNRVKYGDSLNKIKGRVYRDYKPKEETVRSTPRSYISGRKRNYEKVGSFKYESPEYIQFRDKDVDRISYYIGKSIGIPDKDLNSINPNKSPGSNKSFKSNSTIKETTSSYNGSTNRQFKSTPNINSNKKVLWNLGLAGTALVGAGAYVGYKKYKRSKQNKKDKQEYN